MIKYSKCLALLLLCAGSLLPIGCSSDDSSPAKEEPTTPVKPTEPENPGGPETTKSTTFTFAKVDYQQNVKFTNTTRSNVQPTQNLVDKMELIKPLHLKFEKNQLTITDEFFSNIYNYKYEGRSLMVQFPNIGYKVIGDINDTKDKLALGLSFFELQGFNKESFQTLNVNGQEYGFFFFDNMIQRYENMEKLNGYFMHVNLIYNLEK